jgi:hypothetical protein
MLETTNPVISMIHHVNQPRTVVINYFLCLRWTFLMQRVLGTKKRPPCNVIQVKIAANYIDLHTPFIAKHLCYGFTVYPLDSIRLWENVAVQH